MTRVEMVVSCDGMLCCVVCGVVLCGVVLCCVVLRCVDGSEAC